MNNTRLYPEEAYPHKQNKLKSDSSLNENNNSTISQNNFNNFNIQSLLSLLSDKSALNNLPTGILNSSSFITNLLAKQKKSETAEAVSEHKYIKINDYYITDPEN